MLTRTRTTRDGPKPMRMLIVNAVVTALLLGGMSLYGISAGTAAGRSEAADDQVRELIGRIALYDEVLTMSALAGVTTGNRRWEERYNRAAPELDASIGEVRSHISRPDEVSAINATDVANIKLVGLETLAFRLARDGLRDSATALLLGREYATLKQQYAAGMTRVSAVVAEHVARARQERPRPFLVGSVLMLALLVVVWLSSFRITRRFIAEQRQAQAVLRDRAHIAEELRESEERYRLVVENTTDVLSLVDRAGVLHFVNRAAAGVLGGRPSEFTGKSLWDVFPRQFAGEQMAVILRVMDTEQGVVREEPVDTPGGPRWYRSKIEPVRAYDGTINRVLVVAEDITERKRAEAALAESELTYRRVFESSNDAMMLLDSEKFIDCNGATLKVFGYSTREQFLGKHPGQVSPPLQAPGRASRDAADEKIATAFRDGRNFFEWLHQRADGTVFPADVLLTPLDYHGQKVLQATVRDISPRKIAEAEIAQKNVELAKLNELKNQLLGTAAHDLRNPLAVVNTASAFLLDDAGKVLPEATRTAFLRRIQANGEFMLKLIDDLLDVAKIEAGRLDLELAVGDLSALVEENLRMNRMLAEKKRIHLDFVPDRDLPPLRFDGGRVEQVLNNLISNALKFSGPDTTVTVRATRGNGTVVVSVRDQGQGIPAEELDRLFQPFGRTSVQSTAGEKNTGLGLAICRKIVEGHGGRIWAESAFGEGSVFSFSLPVAVAA